MFLSRKLVLFIIVILLLSFSRLQAKYSVKASSIQEGNKMYVADNVLDNDLQTRWSSEFSDDQWLEIDFKQLTEVVGLQLFWEVAYGRSFEILVSQNGKKWQKVYQTSTGGMGLFDDIYFGRRKPRYLKIKFHQRGTPYGYSLWEIKIKGQEEEIKVSASSFKKGHNPENILDADQNTAWQSQSADKEELVIDFQKPQDWGGVIMHWGKNYAREFELQVSDNKQDWQTVYKNVKAEGKKQQININIIHKRYLKIFCSKSSSSAGYEIREIELNKWNNLAKKSSIETVRGLTGSQGFKWNTFIGQDGSFAPEPYPFQVGFWVYDIRQQRLYTPETMLTEWTLEQGRYPVNLITWQVDDLQVKTTIFARETEDIMVNFSRLSIKNTGPDDKDLLVYVKVQPNPCLRSRAGIESIEYDNKNWLSINEEKCILPDTVQETVNDAPEFVGFKIIRSGEKIIDKKKEARGVLVYKINVKSRQDRSLDVFVPSSRGKKIPYNKIQDIRLDQELKRVRKYWQELVPLQLTVPDKEYEDCFYASIYYILIMMNQTELYPGPMNYKTFFLHDAVEMVNALDKVGLNDLATQALQHFTYKEGDGYLDGLGGSLFALYDHFRITKNKDYLKSIYSRIKNGCQIIRKKRESLLKPELKDKEIYGLLPPAVSQDNFKYPAHLYQDNWWALVALKSGMESAKVLNKPDDVEWMTAEYINLKECILNSLQKVMKREKIDYMPAFADNWPPEERKKDADHRILGEAQMGSSHRSALFPGQSLGIDIPKDLFARSYRHYWQVTGKFSGYDGGWYVEYEKLFWGYNAMLAHPLMYIGMEDVSLKNTEWCIKNQSCPRGWMEAMPSREDENGLMKIGPGIIGDVPHGWVAGYYILLLRNMLVREENNSLLLLSCIPEEWLTDDKVIELRNAPTYFGLISFKLHSHLKDNYIELTFSHQKSPSTGYVLHLPVDKNIKQVKIDGRISDKHEKKKVYIPARARKVLVYY